MNELYRVSEGAAPAGPGALQSFYFALLTTNAGTYMHSIYTRSFMAGESHMYTQLVDPPPLTASCIILHQSACVL